MPIKKHFTKKYTTIATLRYISLAFIAFCFAMTAIMVVWMPSLNATWKINQPIDGDDYLYAVNINLHDTYFFAWHRASVLVGFVDSDSITSIDSILSHLDKVTKTGNGDYLHTTGIVVSCVDFIAVVFATTMLLLKPHTRNQTKMYITVSSMLIAGTVIVVIFAYIMRTGVVFGSLFTIELNANLGKDLTAVTDASANPSSVPVTCLDTDYTTLGMIAVSILCIYSGICMTLIALEIKKITSTKK